MSSSSSNRINNCLSCATVLDEESLYISCGQFHCLCDKCYHEYISFSIKPENQFTQIPLKCPVQACLEEYHADKAIYLMTTDEYDTYVDILIKSSKLTDENEIFTKCPFCSFGVIYTKNNIPLFFFCYGCEKMSCTICFKECKYYEENENWDDENEEGENNQLKEDDAENHFKCSEFGPIKKEFDDALEDGNINKCPNCNYKGQKDEYCTHMKCGRCNCNWCYCCGKNIDLMNGDKNHWSEEFKEKKDICPLYLDWFSEEFEEWPEDNNYASEDSNNISINYYHHQKTMYNLKKLVIKFGEEKVDSILKIFPGLLNNIQINEILNFKPCEGLIDRLFVSK